MSLIGDLRALSKAWGDLSDGQIRPLRKAEIDEAKKVFKDTVWYDNIMVRDRFGAFNRPFTLVMGSSGKTKDSYLLYMGPNGFANMSVMWRTFIHEMTHVWQGQTHSISASYMLSSVVAQAISGDNAYNYMPYQKWDDYNSEQQAHLVEDWYAVDGCKPTGDRYPYIRDEILTPGPTAFEVM
jgi:hypothetical protein